MSYTYHFLSVAQNEYEDAVHWYLEKSRIAAVNFISEVDRTLSQICDNPLRWRNEYKDFYEKPLKKYPFSIIYKIDFEMIIVYSVFHHKKNISKKYEKSY